MHDKPTSIELLEALAVFLRDEVAPKLDGGLRFKAIVGANVAGIVAREIALGPAQDRAQLARLAALLGEDLRSVAPETIAEQVRAWSFEVCRRIDSGDADGGPWREELL